jgi:UPF0176 protein
MAEPDSKSVPGTPAGANLPITVMAFYKFHRVETPSTLQTHLRSLLDLHDMKGTILVAKEGLNGTIAGPTSKAPAMLNALRSIPGFAELSAKVSYCEDYPFLRAKVKLKREIVTMGQPDLDPTQPGEYVSPKDWNALIEDPDVLLIDTRNDYEVAIGSFKGAANPNTVRFRDFPEYVQTHLDQDKDKKIAMFCTGGIRCEKSTAYLKSQGFESVYHLEGGILQYLEDVPSAESLWEGDCFVFDERVAVDHQLEPAGYIQCHACRRPLKPVDTERPEYIRGESCHHCADETSEADRARFRERQRQIDLAQSRGESHLGDSARHQQRQHRDAKRSAKAAQRNAERKVQKANSS